MAVKTEKLQENVAGVFYVDEQCIACGVCPNEAPENFKMSDDDAYAFVYKQPDNKEEKSASQDALESCPVDAIGDDGDK